MDSYANECPTTLPLTVFTQRNFVADFLQENCDFREKMAILRFQVPLWGTYRQRTMIILGSLESMLGTSY